MRLTSGCGVEALYTVAAARPLARGRATVGIRAVAVITSFACASLHHAVSAEGYAASMTAVIGLVIGVIALFAGFGLDDPIAAARLI